MRQTNSIFEWHQIEIIAGVCGILLSIIAGTTFIDSSVAWMTGFFSASLALSVAILKEFFFSRTIKLFAELRSVVSEASTNNRKMTTAIDVFAEIEGVHLAHAGRELDSFLETLGRIKGGRLRLSESQYYERIIERMDSAQAGDTILATNSIDERRWDKEPRQLNYMAANKRAMENGAQICRVFIVDKRNLGDARYDEGFKEIVRQLQVSKLPGSKIDAHVVWRQDLPAKEDLVKDWVLFDGDDPEVFQAYADDGSASSHRVWWAELIIGKDENGDENARKFRQNYKKLLAFKIPAERFQEEVEASAKAAKNLLERSAPLDAPPVDLLDAAALPHPVVSCEDAAAAKGIPLSQELKTLLVDTSDGVVAVHVRGNETVSFRKVKEALNVSEAKLASRDQLDRLGVLPGTISPVIEPIWKLRHLLDTDVLAHEYVSTNNGSLTAYVTFDPKLLLQARDVKCGKFAASLPD